MRTLHPGVDVDAVARVVATEYGESEPLRFVPVGGDSWCFAAAPWWVSVRRDRDRHVPAAYEAAVQLGEEFDFVLAPARGRSGAVVHRAGAHPVVVFRLLDGAEVMPWEATPEQAQRVTVMVERVHAHRSTFDLPREDFALLFAGELASAVDRAHMGAAAAGPYGAAVTDLVRRNAGLLADMRAEMAAVQRASAADPAAFVLTHGEPTNVFQAADGRLLLIDWGSLAYGPPERDWRALAELGVPWPAATRAHVRRFYELWWILSEIAEYVDQFTSPHAGDAADDEKWAELALYLQ